MTKDEVIDVIHRTIYGFFDVVEDDSEEPINEKDKLLLEVNKAICNAVKEMPDDERKKGRWIWTCGGTDCHCSLCNVSPLSYTDACGLDGGSIMVESMEFCPCCGAEMEGTKE